MDVRQVSPLEMNWHADLPAYRVYFWEGSSSHEYELSGCHNVREAIAWADENAGAQRTRRAFLPAVWPQSPSRCCSATAPSARTNGKRCGVELFGSAPRRIRRRRKGSVPSLTRPGADTLPTLAPRL